MRKISFGVEIHPYYDAKTVLREIELAERLEYDHVWIGDSQNIWRELYVLLGAAANATSRVCLGSGVTNPVTRIPAVTASALVTLHELSEGRMILGVGSGYSSVQTVGMKASTLAELEDFVRQIRELCRGDTVQAGSHEMRLGFGGADKCPPIFVAASGPKMLRLAGKVGDGAILARVSLKGGVLRKMLECVDEGRRQRTTPAESFQICAALPVCIDADRQKAIAAVRPHVARSLITPLWEFSPEAVEARKKLERLYDCYDHLNPAAPHAEAVPDAVVPEFAIAGTPAECVEQAARVFEMGVDQITIRPYGVERSSRSAMIESFAREVMAPLRKSLAGA
jgi:5,10-methylenetetrahydromethanopterin reductase